MTKDEQGLLIDVACSCLSVDSVKEDYVFPFWKGKSKAHVLHEEAPRVLEMHPWMGAHTRKVRGKGRVFGGCAECRECR